MSIFLLTGAGVSAESGLGTFRDRGGLWARFDPMKLATPEAFASRPDLVHEFYNLRRRGAVEAAPNAAHGAIARLQREMAARGRPVFLCTQNVDDLHERAGSADVVHMHGELLKTRCLACGRAARWVEDLSTATACPDCGTTGRLRPDVVWFGEMPRHLEEIEAALQAADLFVSIGTSGVVYPAAGFRQVARAAGARTVEVNLEPTGEPGDFDEGRYGPASETVPALVDDLLRA